MKIPGYCESCHKIKRVRVSAHGLMRFQARGGAAVGICDSCQDRVDNPSADRYRSA